MISESPLHKKEESVTLLTSATAWGIHRGHLGASEARVSLADAWLFMGVGGKVSCRPISRCSLKTEKRADAPSPTWKERDDDIQ